MLPFSPSNHLLLIIVHTSFAKLLSDCNGRVASVKPPTIGKLVIASETHTKSGYGCLIGACIGSGTLEARKLQQMVFLGQRVHVRWMQH